MKAVKAFLCVFFLSMVALMMVAASSFESGIRTGSGGLQVGDTGTSITLLYVGQVSCASTDTSKTITLAGVTTDTLVLPTFVSGNSGHGYIEKVTAAGGTFTATFSAALGSTTIMRYVVLKKP